MGVGTAPFSAVGGVVATTHGMSLSMEDVLSTSVAISCSLALAMMALVVRIVASSSIAFFPLGKNEKQEGEDQQQPNNRAVEKKEGQPSKKTGKKEKHHQLSSPSTKKLEAEKEGSGGGSPSSKKKKKGKETAQKNESSPITTLKEKNGEGGVEKEGGCSSNSSSADADEDHETKVEQSSTDSGSSSLHLGVISTSTKVEEAAPPPVAAAADTPMSIASSPGSWSALRARQRAQQQSPREIAKGKVRGILNKLTADNLEKLCAQLEEIGVLESQELLECVVAEIFEKATQQHTHRDDHFVGLYTQVCLNIQERLGSLDFGKSHSEEDKKGTGGGKNTASSSSPSLSESAFFTEARNKGDAEARKAAFREILANACQDAFENNQRPPKFAKDMDPEEREEEILKFKTKRLGNMKFVGQLLTNKMLCSNVLFLCAEELLGDGAAVPEDVEALCALLTVAGPFLEKKKWSRKWNRAPDYELLMGKLKEMAGASMADDDAHFAVRKKKGGSWADTQIALPNRVICLIKDLLDLRSNGWEFRKPEEKEEEPKRTPMMVHAATRKKEERDWSELRK